MHRYKKLLTAWKASQPPPRNAKEAAELVIQALQGHLKVDVEVRRYFACSGNARIWGKCVGTVSSMRISAGPSVFLWPPTITYLISGCARPCSTLSTSDNCNSTLAKGSAI